MRNVLVGGLHFGTRLRAAEFGDGAVEQVDLVVEIDNVDGEPFVHVFALGQTHDFAQGTAAQGGLRDGIARAGLQYDEGDEHHRCPAADGSDQGIANSKNDNPRRPKTPRTQTFLHGQDPQRTSAREARRT